LHPWLGNPRKNADAVKSVADSIRKFGFGAPQVARQANRQLIAGHTRLLSSRRLGLSHVPVRFVDLSEQDAQLRKPIRVETDASAVTLASEHPSYSYKEPNWTRSPCP
jgi:hypothetical protein